jgi:hypothetical protein
LIGREEIKREDVDCGSFAELNGSRKLGMAAVENYAG